MEEHERYMRMALELAALARGRTSPNPMVGAVIVKDGEVIGKGYHARAGTPHAEVHALREAGAAARGSTLYVSLEPCSYYGRTPPCTQAIIQAGIKKVIVAMEDPNPLVSGRGIKQLQEAGIEVKAGVLAQDAKDLNEVFCKYITTRLPYVVMKYAMTIDGKIATASGDAKWITNAQAREYVHHLRDTYDSILVGIGTVLADDPLLTTRLPDKTGKNPVRIIVDTYGRLPLDSKIVSTAGEVRTILATTELAPAEKRRLLRNQGLEIILLPHGNNLVSLTHLMEELGKLEITSVLIEGGARINGSALEAGIVDKVLCFIAPKIVGDSKAPGPIAGRGISQMYEARHLNRLVVKEIGDNLLLEGYVPKD